MEVPITIYGYYILLFRGHCLSRWAFCDINQIQDGGQRWRRYYAARRRVENRMDQGRPRRDYRVYNLDFLMSCDCHVIGQVIERS